MKIVVGLGNPGPQYETTRHNVGFLAIDRLVERWRAGTPTRKDSAEVYQANVDGEKTLLVKPLTFMNLSGRCIAPLFGFFKCKPEDLIVLYDDLDLKPFVLRIKTGGGAGGHNGIKSLDEHLGSAQTGYHRVRIGIGHPRELGLRVPPVDYVLQQFSDGELKTLDETLDTAAQAVEVLIKGDAKAAQNKFNR